MKKNVSIRVAAVLAGWVLGISSTARADAYEAVIVEFRGPAAEVRLRVRDFERDVQLIEARIRSSQTDSKRLAADAVSVRVGHVYRHVLQGASAVVPAGAARAIASLPYVRAVHPDVVFQATAIDGVGIVKARQLSTTFSVRGNGIVAAVIDTGIDYRHPAFGGGFGPGQRVVGGYDFVDSDDDPMDENGHGTHVAGILAGNDVAFTGVAPEATLIAYRVLDRGGRGFLSDIAAAVERAVDPNSDGSPDDHVDVINLSLGGAGHADDLLSRAVDAATSAGVIVCASAGNEILLGTVGSPGTARSAITVGATAIPLQLQDLTINFRAGFSSWGPVGRSLEIKPDVVAPGVGILSAKRGGGTVENSGTSMAAPLVAGVAALLKQIHPDWTPADIKAALISTAVHPVRPDTGGGVIDAVAAEQAVVLATPARLSFGVAGAAALERTMSVRLTNHGSRVETLSATIDRDEGIAVTVEPASFTIDPGQSIELAVRLSLPPASPSEPVVPGGSIRFEGTSTLHVPFGVLRGSALTVQYDSEKEFTVWPLPNGALVQPISILAPRTGKGAGETTMFLGVTPTDLLLVDEDGKLIIAENFTADGAGSIVLSPDSARHTVATAAVDDLGQPLEEDTSLQRLCADHLTVFLPASKAEAPLYIDFYSKLVGGERQVAMSPMQTSDISDRFRLVRSRTCTDIPRRSGHAIVFEPLAGVSSSTTLRNTPSQWLRSTAHFLFDPTDSRREMWIGSRLRVEQDFVRRGGMLNDRGAAVRIELGDGNATEEFKFFVARQGSDPITYDLTLEAKAYTPDGTRTHLNLGPFCTVQDGKLVVAPMYGTTDRAFVPAENEALIVNDGPVRAKRLLVPEGYVEGMFTVENSWFGPLHEQRYRESEAAETTLFGPDGEKIQPAITDFIWKHYRRESLASGPHRAVSVNPNYRTAGLRGRATATVTFDTRKEDLTDPEITTLRVLNGAGQTRSRISESDTVTIVFSLADYAVKLEQKGRYDPVVVEATRLSVRAHGADSTWKEVPVRVIGGAMESVSGKYERALPRGIEFSGEVKLPKGHYDLRIEGEDQNGNRTELLVEPAFAVVSGGRRRTAGH